MCEVELKLSIRDQQVCYSHCLYLIRSGTRFDEDIPITDVAAAQDQLNEIRLGPITRARAKLLEQQVNSLLADYDNFIHENFILPNSLHICMIRYEYEASIACGSEELQQEHPLLISNISKCAREEREACAPGVTKEITQE
jgi:hypothetical protein